jgi:hypothetical protein
MGTTEAPGGFYYSSDKRTWVLGDALLIPIMRRIKDEEGRRRAARLFLLHEGMHAHQGLTLGTSPEVGRFPKVLEEIDYQADVWAQLHDRQLTIAMTQESIKDEQPARQQMRIAVKQCSFDDGRWHRRRCGSGVSLPDLVVRYQKKGFTGLNIRRSSLDKPFVSLRGRRSDPRQSHLVSA